MNINNLKSLLTLGKRLIDRTKPCVPLIEFADAKPPFRASEPKGSILRAAPEDAGVSSARLEAFMKELEEEASIGIQSVLIAKDGKLIAERAFGVHRTDVWKNTFSECKSITGLAIGCLFDDGLISPEERVVDIFADRIPPLQKLHLAPMTVRHLLTMTSQICFNEGEAMTCDNWVRGFLTSTLRGPIGASFHYNSLNSFMLSAIVREKTGQSLSDYLARKLFGPMGIENFYWEKSPEGIEKGGWGLYILPRDMLKLGELLRCGGVWQGRRLLSEKWIGMMTTAYQDAPSTAGYFRYGFQMWVGKTNGAWLFNGMYGQNMLIYPQTGYVVVSNASNTDMFQQGAYFPLCDRYFSSPSANAAEPRLPGGIKPAAHKKPWWAIFRFPKAAKAPALPEEARYFADKAFVPVDQDCALGVLPRMMQAVQNAYTAGISRVAFRESGEGRMTVTFTEGERDIPVEIEPGKRRECSLPGGGTEWLTAVTARFARDEDGRPVLIMTLEYLETPFSRTFRFYAEGDTMLMRADEKPGKAFLVRFASVMGEDMVKNPVVESALSRVDRDYVAYKLDALFCPAMEMKREISPREAPIGD